MVVERKPPHHTADPCQARPPALVLGIVLAPMVVAAAVLTVFTVAELGGAQPFSYQPPANLAEAAGMGMAPEVLRRMWAGADPRRVERVRPDIISPDITRVTALEAAIWSRRPQLVRLMKREGAYRDDPDRLHAACLARALRADEILHELAPEGTPDCRPDETIEAIAARSR